MNHSPEICMIECFDKSFDVFFFSYGWERNVKWNVLAEASFLKIVLIVVTGNGVRAFKFFMQGQQEIQEDIEWIVKIMPVAS